MEAGLFLINATERRLDLTQAAADLLPDLEAFAKQKPVNLKEKKPCLVLLKEAPISVMKYVLGNTKSLLRGFCKTQSIDKEKNKR